MDFDFSDDQEQLRDAVRKWVDKGYTFERRRAAVAAGGFDRTAWNELAELGLTALTVPEAHDGMGQGAIDAMVVAEELGRGIVLEPIAQAFIASSVLSHYAPTEVQSAWLPRVASGEALIVLAQQERKARYRLNVCEAEAAQTQSGYAVTAIKSVVPTGDKADAFIVPAQLDGKMALFLVERTASGVTTQGYVTQDGSRAAEVASELILSDKVDLLVTSGTPDTTNPVSDQAEVNEVPCLATNCPWQPYFFGRKGDPAKGFNWTYLFFWGLEDVIAAFTALWDGAPTNKIVGGLFPNDADGNAWGDKERGLPPALAAGGYKLIDPGRYQLMNNDFTSQISAFKAAGAQIVTGNMIPPDFATFWSQAAQQGFKPKIVTIGKALLFPSVIDSLGERGNGLTSEIWWTPHHPFKSGLTGQSAQQLTDGYTKATNRPWTQPIGFQHALFEVAIDVLKRAKNPHDPKSVLDSIVATNYQSMVGHIQWTGQPVKNVTKTPLVAGQWQRKNGKFDLVIAENKTAPEIPVGGKLQPIS